MKKILLTLILAFTFIGVHAQCTPDPQYVLPGIYPDSTTGLVNGVVGQAYNEVITVIVPLDTTVTFSGTTIPVIVQTIELTSVTGLPPNFSYSCAPAICSFPGGSSGCISIFSTSNPTVADTGLYHIYVHITATVDAGSFGTGSMNDSIDYYIEILPVPLTYGCTDSTAFNYDPTATIDDGSCTYQVTNCSELFFSEYVEGTDQNKAIEIYNPTSNAIDLSNYQVERYSNGATNNSPGGITILSGMLAPGDAFVLTNGDTVNLGFGAISMTLYNMGDMAEPNGAYPTPMHMNGNDAIVLSKNGTIIDVFGRVGEDPGSCWTDDASAGYTDANGGTYWTANHTLIRKMTVLKGDDNGLDLFNPSLEWDSLPIDTWNNLGSHQCDCYIYGCTDPLACNYDPTATIDDGSCVYSLVIDTLIISEITCHNANNASITVLATGGPGPYIYSNDNGFNMQSGLYFHNLSPNTYIMYVEDTLGCVARDTVTLINPDSLYIDTTIFSHVQCYGATGLTAGSIQAINAVGGTTPYEYSVNGGVHHANMAYFWGYSPGAYAVEVFDVHNCAAQDIIIITEPSELDVTITTSNWLFNTYQIQCNGDASGFADITANGGVGSYVYTVLDSNGDTTVASSTNSHISGLEAGAFIFVITDANGCTYTETITYNEPSPIVHNFIATHISCSGWSNGFLIDSVWGGVGTATTYSYAWNTGANTYSLSSLSPGIYTDTVVDEIGCISIDSYTISEVNVLTLTVTNSVDVSCYNYCDGVIEVEASGGMPPYTYQWNDLLLQNTATAVGLCAGTYTCTVIDANNCSDTIIVTVTEPSILSSIISITDVTCNGGNDGSIIVTATGGVLPYQYSLDGVSSQSNGTFIGLSEGTYSVDVTDATGCITSQTVVITEPNLLFANPLLTNVSCYGSCDGSAFSMPSGGTAPYNINWSNGQSGQNVFGLCPGIYFVQVYDANGCLSDVDFTITEPTPLISTSTFTNVSCTGLCDGTAQFTTSGGTFPYTYLWSNGDTTATITNLCAGTYTCTVTDVNGCQTLDSVIVTDPPGTFHSLTTSNYNGFHISCYNYCDGYASFSVSGGMPPFTYLWNNGQTTPAISNLCAGSYWVEITDINGCLDLLSLSMIEPYALSVSVDSTDETSALNDGLATAFVNGGVAPYTYLWNTIPPQTTNHATNLAPGLYTVNVTDANGCTISDTTSVNAYHATGIINIKNTSKKLLKITDVLGRETKGKRNQTLFYIYNDGTVEKRIVVE